MVQVDTASLNGNICSKKIIHMENVELLSTLTKTPVRIETLQSIGAADFSFTPAHFK